MIKDLIEQNLLETLQKAASALNLPESVEPSVVLGGLRIERPRNVEHGDFAVNVSSLARYAKMAPPQIAQTLESHFSHAALKTSTIAGFINFQLSDDLLLDSLVRLIHNETPGRNDSLQAQSILLEYVSANPTGPLHIGHGRWAALGDSIRRILQHCGATVTPEFYINDAGFQMEKLAISVWWRGLELLKTQGALPQAESFALPAELPYPGEFVIDLAQEYLDANPLHGEELLKGWPALQEVEPTADNPEQQLSDFFNKTDLGLQIKDRIIENVSTRILAGQKALLDRCGVTFENWYSEKHYLHARGLVEEALGKLRANGYAYEQDGALWFRSTDFGDEKDRVLIKSDGSYTYLAADIAYHDHKYSRRDDDERPQYNHFINIWGADHHGYIARLRGAIEALGHDPNQFEVLLGQLVNLIVDGEKTRMGKRRRMLTLEDVVEEVGVDATRFWMVSKSADTALDFDVALAMSATNENPVFYVQYAHARCSSILRNAVEPHGDVTTGQQNPAYLTAEELATFESSLSQEGLKILFAEADPAVVQPLRTLLLRLDGFEDLVKDAARTRSPHIVARYTLDLAADFHSFYNVCRILTNDPALTRARLMLIRALQKTFAQALELLGVSAPQKM